MTENTQLKLSTYMHMKKNEIYIMAYHADKLGTEWVPEKPEGKEFITYLEKKDGTWPGIYA
jgi:hypothetical protein